MPFFIKHTSIPVHIGFYSYSQGSQTLIWKERITNVYMPSENLTIAVPVSPSRR
jgi:hypothetical protein